MKKSYKDSGVDINAGEKTVDNIKDVVKSTFNSNVLTGIGHFGAFYELNPNEFDEPVLVSSVDGVGTKLKIAIESKIFGTIGQDLVNHCVNDIAVCGAKPLYFLDYMAFGKLVPENAAEIVNGFAHACRENGVALIGGETAEMPGIYEKSDFDLSGTIVGIVEKSKIINGSDIVKGDVLIGYHSNGLHTNGFSLARSVLLEKLGLNDFIKELNSDLKTELLKIHKSYMPLIRYLISQVNVKGLSHITGGGIVGNTSRILPKNQELKIDWNSWETPPIFNLIQEIGNISESEMKRVFNMGIGLIAIISPEDVEEVLNLSKTMGENPIIIGNVI
ncbi:MAG: phosphoribosylformylglycinamidine cyclo-ligase [Melioribacteraceae bacterium]|nr:phosphoribosylformylglycinamidine cyclo-ligase [Melioribacteraceae bacterium]